VNQYNRETELLIAVTSCMLSPIPASTGHTCGGSDPNR
jgi:hypothetical protein